MAIGPGYRWDAGSRGALRASAVDRDRVAELITAAFAEGRLSRDEHDARVGRALAARTYAELDVLTADLPRVGVPAARANPLAVAALVCGLGQTVLWPLATVPAIVLGHVARRQIRRTGERGGGLALAGLVLGWIGAGAVVVAATVALVVFLSISHGTP